MENYMVAFWDQAEEDGARKVNYAQRQREHLFLRIIGQIAIPIEAALAEEEIPLD